MVTAVEILGSEGEKYPFLQLDRTRDGLAAYCARRWPVGRRKSVAREWGLSADEARSVCEGSASQATLDKVWRHPQGGWTVLLPVMGAVVGQSIHDFFRAQMLAAAKAQQDALEHEKLAQAAWSRLADPDCARMDRTPRTEAGEVGASKARGVVK